MLDFSIAGIHIRILSDVEMRVIKAFEAFLLPLDEKSIPQYVVNFQAVSELNIPKEKCIYQEGKFLIYPAGEHSFQRAFRCDTGTKEIYAVSICEAHKNQVKVTYLDTERDSFSDVQKAFLHIGWEWILMKEGKLMLHASCVKTQFGGIVFSGPSGIGKSTQAGLWCEYADATLINGDKTILTKQENVWRGHGSPYAGSSGCYVNDECPVRAIVFLKQDDVCSLRKLNVTEGFKKIYTGLTINYWDSVYVEKVSNLALALALDIPTFEFSCTPDRQAVDYLKEKIFGGEKFE